MRSYRCGTSTFFNLAPVQGRQLVNNNPSPPSPLSPTTSTKAKEDQVCCAICTILGKECPGRFATSDWDDEDDNTREKEQEQPEASTKLPITLTQTLQPPKPYITKYSENMTNNPPIRFTPKDRWMCEIIVAQQELNMIVWWESRARSTGRKRFKDVKKLCFYLYTCARILYNH